MQFKRVACDALPPQRGVTAQVYRPRLLLPTSCPPQVTNSLTDLHEKQDRNRVLQALLVMLLWELLWAVPLMWIIDPTISQWFRNDLRTYLTGRVVDKYMNHRNAYYYVKVPSA